MNSFLQMRQTLTQRKKNEEEEEEEEEEKLKKRKNKKVDEPTEKRVRPGDGE